MFVVPAASALARALVVSSGESKHSTLALSANLFDLQNRSPVASHPQRHISAVTMSMRSKSDLRAPPGLIAVRKSHHCLAT